MLEITFSVVNLALQVKKLRHGVKTVVVSGNDQHGNLKVFHLLKDKTVSTGLPVFVGQVTGQYQQVYILYGLGTESLLKIGTHINPLHEVFVLAYVEIRYLPYLQQLTTHLVKNIVFTLPRWHLFSTYSFSNVIKIIFGNCF